MDSIFGWMANAAIDSSGGGEKVFGVKPKVAKYSPTDLGEEASRATKANTRNMDDIMALLDKILPGTSEMFRQGSKNTQSLLRGEIPEDVQRAVQRSSAFRSLSGGFGGSPMSKALTARDFGRTSMDLMQAGENSAQRWMGMSQGSVKPFIVTAPDQAEATFKNRLYDQATSQFQFNIDAAADPSAAGLFNLRTALGMQAMGMGMGALAGTGGAARPTTAAAPAASTTTTTGAPTYAGASSLGNWWGGYGG